jgi:DNA-binding transcriptional ArsR family regulator
VEAEGFGADNADVTSSTQLADLAGLLADRTRAAMCLALLDGRAWTAGELAQCAGVARSTASEQLDRLVAGGLLVERRQGRHRYVELAGPSVARLIEDLAGHVRPAAATVTTLRAGAADAALRRGRTCYDHLAGRLGVRITDAMTARGLLDQSAGFALTGAGRAWLDDVAGEAVEHPPGSRPAARACLDWTERRPHLAGRAGARLCAHHLSAGWIERIGSGRAVRVTSRGRAAFEDVLGIDDLE